MSSQMSSLDPLLPVTGLPSTYVDVFVDNFVALAQGGLNRQRMCHILLHVVNDVLHPLDTTDSKFCHEPVSLKKLRKRDCS